MSKGGKGKAKHIERNKQQSKSNRAGLNFPVGRIARMLKKGRYSERIGIGAPVYLAAILEYLVAEILEVSVMVVKQNKKARIVPRYIFLGLKEDEEFKKLFAKTIITASGVKPDVLAKKNK
jgi:histone H2A